MGSKWGRRGSVVILLAVCAASLVWCDVASIGSADELFEGWWQEWEYRIQDGSVVRLHGWRLTNTGWMRIQGAVRALLFPVVFYRILTAEPGTLHLLARRVRSPSRALSVAFCSLWPMRGDYLGYAVLWTLLLCRCLFGLGEMVTSDNYTWNNVVQLLAPLPGIVAGHLYFRQHRHFWGFVTLNPFRTTRAPSASDADMWVADASPVAPRVVRGTAPGAQHAVYVSVDWVKYGPDKDSSVTRSGSVPDLSIDPHAWFADNETSTELASPSRCHSKSAFAADSFLGKRHRRRSTGHALHGGSPQAMTPASADPRLNHRRSFSADYVDDGASGSTAQDAASAGGSEVPAPRTPARAAPSGGAASASPGSATLVRNLSSDEPRRTRTRGSSGDGSTRRRRRGGIRRRQSFSQDGSGTAATPPRPSVNVRVPRADIKRVSVNGKVRLRKSDSLLDRAVTARGMLGLAVVAAVLSSVDAFCQYFLRPSLYDTWAIRQLVIGRWRDTVLSLYLAPGQVALGFVIVTLGMHAAGFGLRQSFERVALGWLSYFSFLAMHRWCDIIFTVAVGIVYRSHMEEALELIGRVGASVVDPSEYQRLLRKIKASNRAMKHLLWYIALNGAAYFVADSYSRFWGKHPDDASHALAWVAFGARHCLSVMPPAVLLWNMACLNETTHDKMVDRWLVMFLHWHQLDRLVKWRREQIAADALARGQPPQPDFRLCFERYECTDWISFVKDYRRGYWDVMSWVSKKAFYTWIFVALFTTVQSNWMAALQHVQSLVARGGV